MTREKLERALSETHRFMEAARQVINVGAFGSYVGTKETGALRRASLDLTRALADLRRRG